MATPIKINVDVDMQAVIDQAKRGGDALEDMGDAFGDVESASTDAARSAERALDGMVDSFDDVEGAAQGAAQSADEIGKIGPAADTVSGSLGDLGGVAQDVLQGDFASGAQGAISSIAGIASAIPGIGVAAGIAAAGASVIAGVMAENERATEEAAARASEWADAYVEAGSRIVGAAHATAEVTAIATDPERYKQAQDNAKNWGVDTSTAMLAMAGNATALGVAQQALADRTAELDERLWQHTLAQEHTSFGTDMMTNSVNAGKDAMAQLTGDMAAGAAIADTVSSALLTLAGEASSVSVEVDALGNKLLTLPDDTKIVIDAETGKASQAVSKFKGDTDGVIDHISGRAAVIKASIDDAAVRNYKPPTLRGTIVYGAQVGGAAGANKELWQ